MLEKIIVGGTELKSCMDKKFKLKKFVPTRFMLPTSHYDKERADHAVNFIEQLKHTKGVWAGQPFELIAWQEELIRNLFGIIKPDGYRQFQTAFVETSKKSGKALAVDTPIPTPDGFKRMQDIKTGDMVFDENGKPCTVLGTSNIMENHECFKVSFSDGDSIVADADHLWSVGVYTPDKKPYTRREILTTKQMLGAIKNKRGCYNYRIDINGCLDLPKQNLPVHPYVLGAWLGDGNSHGATITININDMRIVENINRYGVPTKEYFEKNEGSRCFVLSDGDRRQSKRNICFQSKLREMGLLCNKHIPTIFLQSDRQDRMLLLQGLMDTDGFVNVGGECEYTSVNKKLAEDILYLIRSLGYKASMGFGRAMLNGKDCGKKYRIVFFGFSNEPVCTVPRKALRLKALPQKKTRNSFKTITAIEPVTSVPVKCISVDSNSHLFLAGKGLTATHNSELAAAIALYTLCADMEAGAEVYSCASDRKQAGIVFEVAKEMVIHCPALKKRMKILDSTKRMVFHPLNSIYQVLSSDVASKFGYNVHACIFDELLAQPNRKLYDVMTKGAGIARKQPLNFVITTAGSDRNSICYEVHQKAMDIIEGRKIDPTFYPVVYCTPMDADWTDPKVWKKSNPSLGVTFTKESLQIACDSAKENPAEEMFFRQFFLCQWTQSNLRWMPMDRWDKCGFPVDMEELQGRVCYGGLDLSSTTDVTAFVLVFPPEDETDKYIVLPFFWVPKDNLEKRVQKDHVPYDVWEKQGAIRTTDGNVVHYGFIESFIEELGTKYNIKEIAFDRWGAVQMTQNLEGLGFTVVPFGQGFKDMSPPTKELMKLTLEEKIAHGGHPVLRWMMDNIAIRTDPAGNIKPDKEKSTERIDGAVATIMALDRAIRCGGKPDTGSVYDSRGLIIL